MTELAKSVLEVLRKYGTVETLPAGTPPITEFRDGTGEFVFRRQGENVEIYQRIGRGAQQPGSAMFFRGEQLTPELRARIGDLCRSVLGDSE